MSGPTPTTRGDRAREAAGMAPAGKQLTRLEQGQRERIGLVQQQVQRFQQVLRDKANGERFVIDAINVIRTTPQLGVADELSLLGALMTAAQLDLRPNLGALGHCWVLPFENKRRGVMEAQFIMGYRGMITVAGRSGISTVARTIYEGEDYDIQYGLDEHLHHRPNLDADRSKPIAHYAILRSGQGNAVWRIMSHAQTLEVRDKYSMGYKGGRPDNPWAVDADNDWAMSKKTVIRRTFGYTPTDSPELAIAMAADDRVVTYDPTSGQTSLGDEPLAINGGAEPVEPPGVVEHAPAPAGDNQPTTPAKKAAPKKATGRRATPKSPTEPVEEPPPDTPAEASTEGGPSAEDIARMNAEATAQEMQWRDSQ